MAVSKQQTFYFDLCVRKGVLPEDISNMHGGQVGNLIEALLQIPDKATDKQITTLRNMIQELVDAGVPGIKQAPDRFYRSLNAKTFQEWYNNTRALRARFLDMMPASDKQIEEIANMYLFPEIEWERISITKRETAHVHHEDDLIARQTKISYEENITINRKIVSDEVVPETGAQMWRYMTTDEFKEELKAKLTHASASKILDQYTGAYQAWLRTRITRGQKQQIRKMEQRLANIFVPKEKTVFDMDMPFDFDALDTNVEADVDAPFQVKSNKFNNWNPVAYEGLKEEQLDMMSREDADAFMKQLRYELQAKELYSAGGAQNLDYENYGIEEARTAKNIADARTQEFKDLNNFLFGLSDITGHMFEVTDKRGNPLTIDSLRHDALQTFFDSNRRVKVGEAYHEESYGASQEAKTELRGQIADFILLALRSKSIRVDGLMNLADTSLVASEIVDSLIRDKDIAQELMMLQRRQR